MKDNTILVPSLEDNKITWSEVKKPKISTSNPKLTGRAKAVPISQLDETDEAGQTKWFENLSQRQQRIQLNNLSVAQILAVYNFSQDILERVPEDGRDAVTQWMIRLHQAGFVDWVADGTAGGRGNFPLELHNFIAKQFSDD